jgi:predicted transcriptional regulator
MDAAESFRERRIRTGLTRGELAGLAGCSPSYVQMLDEGYVPRRGSKVAAVVKALNDHEIGQKGGPDA